jgi:apolipoprotein N-acyltransferase
MLRVANNGISAVIDAVGRIPVRINLDTIGYADVALPPAGGRTLYSRIGDWALLALFLLGALPIALRLP